jgi:hypothetical protein
MTTFGSGCLALQGLQVAATLAVAGPPATRLLPSPRSAGSVQHELCRSASSRICRNFYLHYLSSLDIANGEVIMTQRKVSGRAVPEKPILSVGGAGTAVYTPTGGSEPTLPDYAVNTLYRPFGQGSKDQSGLQIS